MVEMRDLNTCLVADDLVNFLSKHYGVSARVHSVFPHAVNFQAVEELITLTNHGDITPMGLIMEGDFNFSALVKLGDEFLLKTDAMVAADGRFRLLVSEAQVWQTAIYSGDVPLKVEEINNKRIAVLEWLEKQEKIGLLPLLTQLTGRQAVSNRTDDNVYSRFIGADLEAFVNQIEASDWRAGLKTTDKLVGFGVGSTPSCDDFLAAYLAVFTVAEGLHPGRFPWVTEFNQAVAKTAQNQSTLISAVMLRHAANSKISRSHQSLIRACLFEKYENPLVFANQVLQYGATSGADFLLGLVCALDWYRRAAADILKEEEEVQAYL